jgi:ABC-2 type transport system ATP-binding protein
MPAVEMAGLSRVYRGKASRWRRGGATESRTAVDDLSLSIEAGELFGLLGPNGAGKTTTIRMLCTLLLPTSGAARVAGLDVVRDAREVRSRIGFAFGGDKGLYDRLTALENLTYFADLYGLAPREQRTRIPELLDVVGLRGRERDRVEGYSRGMRQRLHIARSLLHRPRVLFLDEPTNGLDPVGARELRLLVRQLADRGTTLILTTHYMNEAEALCDRIGVIAGGRLRALGSPRQLKQQSTARSIAECELFGAGPGLLTEVRVLPNVSSVTEEVFDQRQRLIAAFDGRPETQAAITALMRAHGARRVLTRPPTLEDAYIAIVGGS